MTPTNEWRSVRLVPILHNRVEFALEVRRQFEAFRPDCVAVEIPDTLRERVLQGIARLPLLSVVYYEEKDGEFIYLLLEPTDGQVEAIRLANARGIPVHFVDRDTESYPLDAMPFPDPYAVTRIGYGAYCRAFLDQNPDPSPYPDDTLREMTMAFHLQRLSAGGRKVLFVGGLYHLPGILHYLDQPCTQVIGRTRRQGVGLGHLHEESSREILMEMPFLVRSYEEGREDGSCMAIDRMERNHRLLDAALERHWKRSRERVNPHQLRVLYTFARNYALVSGALLPSFYQLIVASRGAVNDNFAYEVWDMGSEYPWQSQEPNLPVLRLTGDDLFVDQKRIRFHRRFKAMRRRLVPVPVKKRPRERMPGEWKKGFKGFSICSYPPEDVVIEGYGARLKRHAMEIKSRDSQRIVPFVASVLDGLDLRETLRNWFSGKIYVREETPARGKVGSVVVIFDPDRPGEKGDKEAFPWCVTWLGEHSQESDMAFYSTPAGLVMDGPGISRCQYGGFMLSYPPMRVYDVWRDAFFDAARDKPERLLMAALDYSLERNVVYVAAAPPSGWCQGMAARLGKKILYLPIGVFSPVTLEKIRQFHVLDGHPVREYADRYIG